MNLVTLCRLHISMMHNCVYCSLLNWAMSPPISHIARHWKNRTDCINFSIAAHYVLGLTEPSMLWAMGPGQCRDQHARPSSMEKSHINKASMKCKKCHTLYLVSWADSNWVSNGIVLQWPAISWKVEPLCLGLIMQHCSVTFRFDFLYMHKISQDFSAIKWPPLGALQDRAPVHWILSSYDQPFKISGKMSIKNFVPTLGAPCWDRGHPLAHQISSSYNQLF